MIAVLASAEWCQLTQRRALFKTNHSLSEIFRHTDYVPKDHLVCKIDAAIDFEFFPDAVKHLYYPDNGSPPLTLST